MKVTYFEVDILLILCITNMHLFLFSFFLKNKTGHKKKETLPRTPTTAFLERSRRDLSGKKNWTGVTADTLPDTREHMGQARGGHHRQYELYTLQMYCKCGQNQISYGLLADASSCSENVVDVPKNTRVCIFELLRSKAFTRKK